MGRRIPTSEIHLIHPVISFSLLAAGMAAAIAIISGLCGVRCRRKSSSSSTPPTSKSNKKEPFAPPSTTTIMTPPSSSSSQTVESHKNEVREKDDIIHQLPLPPSKMIKRATRTYSFKGMTKSTSDRNIAASLSMKVTRSFSMARSSWEHNKEESKNNVNHGGKKAGKLKMDHQDSIWMKTIILGEKCKVPDEEEEAVIYEGKGKKISAYHPRTASSLSISRQCSFIDQEAIYSIKST
ncbi:hypothetical protein TorRG33x02_082510 [Trema orientale]|uniref:Transmembrane protein n=1 Tax=Trema orientale TaxID=63057 RepID=A0A2P5FDZ0_TREOI|nr:hypothetical protein TorRG33x02_082510 [Trema orientale]